jgi:hypothetical protein
VDCFRKRRVAKGICEERSPGRDLTHTEFVLQGKGREI